MLNIKTGSKIAIATTVVMLVARPADAHRDARLRLQENGAVTGLPEKYLPAYLSFEHEYRFPKCMLGLFEKHQNVELSSSWYHSESVLPYYLAVKVQNEGRVDDSFSLLFNLTTAQLLKVDKISSVRGEVGTSGSEPFFEKLCPGKKMIDGWKRQNESSTQ